MGVLQLHLSGGEPASRRDLVELVRGAAEAGLYTNLITSGLGLGPSRLSALVEAGLDHLQLSIQDVDEAAADASAGLPGSQRKKRQIASEVVASGLAFTLNLVIHRGNIARVGAAIDAAVAMGAQRIEVAHAEYYGWASRNRVGLLPSREQARAAHDAIGEARERFSGRIAIDYVAPDFLGRYPKPCMNGWARRSMNIAPDGTALPCHAAATIPGLTFWNVREHSLAEIWQDSPAFEAYRGTGWMREPCMSCPRRETDFGGCRCQALAITGDARNTDPVCHLSPHRSRIDAILAMPQGHLVRRGEHEASVSG